MSIKVTGGPLLAAGRASPGKTNIFSGASSGHRISYDVSGGARVLVRDVWYEGGAGPGFAQIHDPSDLHNRRRQNRVTRERDATSHRYSRFDRTRRDPVYANEDRIVVSG